MGIRVFDALKPAFDRTVDLLYKPFNFTNYLKLGFVAWIISIGSGGSFSNFSRADFLPQDKMSNFWESCNNLFYGEGGFIKNLANLFSTDVSTVWLVIGIAAGIIAAGIAISVLILWIRCSFEFIWLDDLIKRKSEIGEPWKAFRADGNSLFGGLLLCFAVVAVVYIALFGGSVAFLINWLKRGALLGGFPGWDGGFIAAAVLFVISILIGWAFLVYIGYVRCFAAPVMYGKHGRFALAFVEVNALLKAHFWGFVRCGLLWTGLSLGVGMACLALIVCTCCIACCLLSLPFVGAVVLLPWYVFSRYYTLEVLSQVLPKEENC